jgi:hypothetical protein
MSGDDMRESAQNHPDQGDTLVDPAETSSPDFQTRDFCPSFASPALRAVGE